ncbi:MAG: DUF1194 domain-containing protein [Rhodovibrionaceae bacterium]
MKLLRALCLALLLALPAAPFAGAQEPVDLELLLAVDASGSIDREEFALQMGGIAAAFRDPELLAALRSGPHGRIAVTLMLWAEANRPKQTLPWHLVRDDASAEAFARAVAEMPRDIAAGGTGIGKALQYSVWEIQRNAYQGLRKVIDLSGDGRETAFREFSLDIDAGRYLALQDGITVNGLAILSDVPELESYYAHRLIGGFGAFVMTAASFEDFARAFRRKLLREVDYKPQVSGR